MDFQVIVDIFGVGNYIIGLFFFLGGGGVISIRFKAFSWGHKISNIYLGIPDILLGKQYLLGPILRM